MDYREPWYNDDANREYTAADVQKLHFSHEESAHTTTSEKELDNYVDNVAKAFHKNRREMWWKSYMEKLRSSYHKDKYNTLINKFDWTMPSKETYGSYDRRVADADSGDISPGGVM